MYYHFYFVLFCFVLMSLPVLRPWLEALLSCLFWEADQTHIPTISFRGFSNSGPFYSLPTHFGTSYQTTRDSLSASKPANIFQITQSTESSWNVGNPARFAIFKFLLTAPAWFHMSPDITSYVASPDSLLSFGTLSIFHLSVLCVLPSKEYHKT